MKLELPRAVLRRIVLSLAGTFLVAMGITWMLHDALSAKGARDALERALDDVQGQIEEDVNKRLILKAMLARDALAELTETSPETLRTLANELRVDEICIADNHGTFIASTSPEDIGQNCAVIGGQAAEFMCLLKSETEFAQPLLPSSVTGEERKYVGVWRPEGGFVQVGCLVPTLRRAVMSVLVGITHFRHPGGAGRVVVTTETGEIVSDVIETGLEGSGLELPGDDVFSSSREIEGFRVYAFLPKTTAALWRNTMVGVSATLTILLIVFAVLFVGISVAGYVREQMEKRLAADLEVAKNIQTSALPEVFPPFPDELRLDIYARMDAAREVGGDFYDFDFVGNDLFAVLIADVSGKGVSAAMFMMKAKTTIKSCLQAEANLTDALALANDRLAEGNAANIFVTCWVGVVDLKTGVLTYVNAGHNPPYIRRADGTLEGLKAVSGPPLGVIPGVAYRPREATLAPGDLLYLYTDGVTESINMHEEQFGTTRLESLVTATSRPDELCSRTKDAVDAFAHGMEQFDDITSLAFLYRGAPKTETRSFPATLESLAEVTAFVEGSLDATSCPDATKAKILIAVDEIASNIARYSGSATMRVTFELAERPRVVRLTFADSGTPWNPLAHRDPNVTEDLASRPIGGLGILMVKKLMDAVRYEWQNGENVLALRKELPWDPS